MAFDKPILSEALKHHVKLSASPNILSDTAATENSICLQYIVGVYVGNIFGSIQSFFRALSWLNEEKATAYSVEYILTCVQALEAKCRFLTDLKKRRRLLILKKKNILSLIIRFQTTLFRLTGQSTCKLVP